MKMSEQGRVIVEASSVSFAEPVEATFLGVPERSTVQSLSGDGMGRC